MNKMMLFLGLMTMSLVGPAHSAALPQGGTPEGLKVLTFNIDTNIGRTEEGNARDSHPEWRVGSRMPAIKSSLKDVITKYSPDVIQIQEGRKFITKFGDEVDSITPLMDFFAAEGYQVSTEQYNPTDRSFSFITAIKNNFMIDGYEKFYFTKTPNVPTDHSLSMADIKDHNYGEEWERCVYITDFRDALGRHYRLKNVHLGIGELHRKKACEMLRQDSEQAIALDPAVLEVTTGDFNTFPDWGGPAQLEIMAQNAVLEEVTKDLRLLNGKRIDSTFIAFPYDFAADEKRLNAASLKDAGKPLAGVLYDMPADARREKIDELFVTECKALGGHLDRVYQHGFAKARATLLPTPQFDDFDKERVDESSVKDFVVRHLQDGPAFASDHQPILVECELKQAKRAAK